MSYIGTNKIGKVYLGTTEIAKMYLGSDLVYQNAPPNYFWTEAISTGTFTLTIPSSVTVAMLSYVSYSTDGGTTWTKTDNSSSAVTITTPSISAGNKVLWKGEGSRYASSYSGSNYSYFSGSADYNIGGDIASLFTGDACSLSTVSSETAMFGLFKSNSHLINAEDLILSPTKIATRCCQNMFDGCSNLLTAPTLCFEEVGNYACYSMFGSCSKLVVAPSISITKLGGNSCQNMFNGCSSLETPPSELPATSLANSCYYSMFRNCAKLTSVPDIKATTYNNNTTQWCREMFYGCKLIETAPVLHITKLASNAYYRMFYNCNKLAYIKMMATDISASNCLYQWVSSVASSGTFVKNSSATWTTTGVSGVPSGWTVQTASS